MLVEEKKRLTFESIESQTALELPERDLLGAVVIIVNVANGNELNINVSDINVAAQVCAIVDVINVLVGNVLVCDFGEN